MQFHILHSLSTLLRTPTHLHNYAVIAFNNYVEAGQCDKSCRFWPRAIFSAHIKHRNEEKVGSLRV